MKEEKCLSLSSPETINKVINIVQAISVQYNYSVASFNSSWEFYDGNVYFDELEEFKNNKDNYSNRKICLTYTRVDFETISNNKDLSITIATFDDTERIKPLCTIEIRSKNIILIKNVFSLIQKIFDKKYIRYSPESHKKNVAETATEKLVKILKKFESYHLRRTIELENEKRLQEFLYPILKSHFPDLEEEASLSRFGNKSYVPDFTVPSAYLILECKYIGKNTKINKTQKEIIDDSVGYLNQSSNYSKLIVFVYNAVNMPINEKFKKDLKTIKGIKEIIISPGINVRNSK
jgi:hypothetical protein